MTTKDLNHKKMPEDWLQKIEDGERATGRLKVFLGYAPGVGKTFSMLSEGARRTSRGEDVVIGVVETHGRAGTAQVAESLERVPMRQIEYRGTLFAEMDLDAILQRHPAVALIDELAHTNIEGSKFEKRYQDVFALLEAKIDVVTTLNVQHIESLTPRVRALTGVTVRETVPDWVLERADEIVMSDLTPEALATRMRRGDIYPLERAERALGNFFRKGNLIALREMALQRVTRAVDRTLDDYVKVKHLGAHWTVAERIAVCVSSRPTARDLIARGARLAKGMDADLYVLHLDGERDLPENAGRILEDNLAFAVNLGAHVVHLSGKNVVDAVTEFAKRERITQAIFGSPELRGLKKVLYFWQIARFRTAAPHVDLHIVTQDTP